MALINLTLQGKGGVGKSFVAALLAQYHSARGARTVCFDTDPVNRTFAGYEAFAVETVRLGERADEVDPGRFDALMESLMTADRPASGEAEPSEPTVVVVDNGASTFLPFIGYVLESDAMAMLLDAGHEIRAHTVITGGQSLEDTVRGLGQVLNYLPSVRIVVWLNEYFGRVEKRTADGGVEGFEQSGLYRKHKARIYGLARLHGVRRETFGRDLEAMMRSRLTFEQAISSPDFGLMSRQRLKRTWRILQAEMEGAGL